MYNDFMTKDSMYFSNYPRSGFEFMRYLISLCPNLPIFQSGHNIQTTLRTITIIRNPMDVCASSIINDYGNKQNINETIKQREQKYVKFYKEILKQDNLIIIDFEDITTRPEETLKAIHKLLDLPFLMSERDKNIMFNEGGHLHTSKTHEEYDRIRDMVYAMPHTESLIEYNKVLDRKLIV